MRVDKMDNGKQCSDKNKSKALTKFLENQKLRNLTYLGKSEQKRLIGKDNTITPTPTAQRIGFTAVTTDHQMHLMIDSTVHFLKVITNAGNGFDPNTGIFRAPVSGLYLFSASILSLAGHEVRCEIAKNGDVVAYIFSGDNATYSTGTQSVLLDLVQHDEIWIKITNNNDVHVLGGGWSSFIGVLISQ
ncbi:cerebellin-2-like [Saccostrea cucullata]|uniref:cerebellin-2-like n=1 Tax=Saccostrea cuccullata TaxID=36930 RepID=UPI002ED0C161